jgi:hypothetical protein
MPLNMFKNRVLWRVYFIWFFRRIVPLMAIQAVILGLALKIFAEKVFVRAVLQNAVQVADSGYWAFFKYLVISFLGTRPLVQIAILLGLGVSALIIRDLTRSLFTYKAMRLRRR